MQRKERWGIDMDEKRIESLIQWWRETDTQGMDSMKYLITPLMEAFGEDAAAILAYLEKMEVEDLREISGCFESIYRKFMTDDVYNALGELEDKIA